MGTTADKLNGLLTTKNAIKQAIIDKGVAVDEAATFASYASKIGEIQAGSAVSSYCTAVDPQRLVVSDSGSKIPWESIFNNTTEIGVEIDASKIPNDGVKVLSPVDSTSLKKVTVNFVNGLPVCNLGDFVIRKPNIEEVYIHGTNIWNMSGAFQECPKLRIVDLSGCGMDPNNCQHVAFYTFVKGSPLLEYLDFSGLDAFSIPELGYTEALVGCTSLKHVRWPNNFGRVPDKNQSNWALDIRWSPLDHDSVLDLFNKIPIYGNSSGSRKIYLKQSSYDLMTPEELKIADDKHWNIVGV